MDIIIYIKVEEEGLRPNSETEIRNMQRARSEEPNLPMLLTQPSLGECISFERQRQLNRKGYCYSFLLAIRQFLIENGATDK